MNQLAEKLKKMPVFASCRWPLFILLFICFGAAILGDSTAESLLLSHFDAKFIPNMFLVNAFFLFFMSAFMMSVIDRVNRGTFFLLLAVCHGCVLILIRVLVMMHAQFLYLPLFSYAYVTKILLFLMFWTLANDLVDSRRASKEFPFIAAGGTIGAILISFSIPSLLKVIPAENLLVVWAVLSIILGILFIPFKIVFGAAFIPSADRPQQGKRTLKNIFGDLKLLQKEPLLRNMAIFYFILFFILLNQHYVFYSQLKKYLCDAKSLGSFLGYFNGTSMFATVILQVGVAGFILKKIGSTRSMLFLPAVLCGVFAVQTVIGALSGGNPQPGTTMANWLFWSIVSGMGLRVAFFDSFFSPNFQVFFSSLPQDVRGRGKLSIEGVIKPAAIIFASLWMLFVLPKIPFCITTLLLFLLSALVMVQTFRIRKRYAQSLTSYLSGFRSKKLPALFNLVDIPDTENYLAMLSIILEKEEYEIKKFIIEILAAMNTKESIDVLLKYLESGDDKTRATIISSLAPLKKQELRVVFSKLLTDGSERVVANSILALAQFEDAETQEGLETFLHHSNTRIKVNTIVLVWRQTKSVRRKDELSKMLVGLLESTHDSDKASALYAIGEIHMPQFLPALTAFIAKEKSRIIENHSLRRLLINACAQTANDEAFDIILSLSDGTVVGLESDLAKGIVELIDKKYSVARCLARLQKEHYIRQRIILLALYQRASLLTEEFGDILEEVAKTQVASIYGDWLAVSVLDTKDSLKEVNLLRTVVYEVCIVQKLKNLILIAALCDSSGHIGAIMQRLYHPNRHVRARAFEVLDNVGNVKINRWLINLLDTDDAVTHGREATFTFKQRSRPLFETVEFFCSHPNQWLTECAEYAAHALFVSTKDERWKKVSDSKRSLGNAQQAIR